jgi:hypothetical protein
MGMEEWGMEEFQSTIYYWIISRVHKEQMGLMVPAKARAKKA